MRSVETGGRVQIFTVPLSVTPDYTVPRPRGRLPTLGFLVVLIALLSLRNFKLSSLPPFPDHNKTAVLNPVVWARRGPQHCTHPSPLPAFSGVMGVGRASLVVSRGGGWVWEQVVIGEGKGENEGLRRQAWKVLMVCTPTPPPLHPQNP